MKTRHYPFYGAACQTLWSVGVCRCGWRGLYVALRWLHKGDRSLQGAFVEFAFRLLRRAKGGCLPSPPLAIPRAPGYAALRVRCVARASGGRQNSALRASNRLPSSVPPALRYSPTQTGTSSPRYDIGLRRGAACRARLTRTPSRHPIVTLPCHHRAIPRPSAS